MSEPETAPKAKPKFPLRGMPFDRQDLDKASARAFRLHPTLGRAEARHAGYRWLLMNGPALAKPVILKRGVGTWWKGMAKKAIAARKTKTMPAYRARGLRRRKRR